MLSQSPTRLAQDGYSVAEVSIVMALLAIVSVILFSLLGSLTNNERRTQALVSNEQDVRFVVNEILRDLRQSNPLEAIVACPAGTTVCYSSRALYESTIVLEQGETTPKTFVRWTYDTTPGGLTLRRETCTASCTLSTGVWTGVTRLTRVRNVQRTPPVPMFQYFSQSGKNLVTGPFSSEDVGNCAIRVRVTVTADSNPGPEPFTESADVHLRNRLPGGLGCG